MGISTHAHFILLLTIAFASTISCTPADFKIPSTLNARAKRTSPDGTCAGKKDFTCQGSRFGNCCSQYGWCGSSDRHCGAGCQRQFGTCSTLPAGSMPVSFDKCGPTNGGLKCSPGLCCSQYGWCGSTSAHCSAKCQPEYGNCDSKSSSSKAALSSNVAFASVSKVGQSSSFGLPSAAFVTSSSGTPSASRNTAVSSLVSGTSVTSSIIMSSSSQSTSTQPSSTVSSTTYRSSQSQVPNTRSIFQSGSSSTAITSASKISSPAISLPTAEPSATSSSSVVSISSIRGSSSTTVLSSVRTSSASVSSSAASSAAVSSSFTVDSSSTMTASSTTRISSAVSLSTASSSSSTTFMLPNAPASSSPSSQSSSSSSTSSAQSSATYIPFATPNFGGVLHNIYGGCSINPEAADAFHLLDPTTGLPIMNSNGKAIIPSQVLDSPELYYFSPVPGTAGAISDLIINSNGQTQYVAVYESGKVGFVPISSNGQSPVTEGNDKYITSIFALGCDGRILTALLGTQATFKFSSINNNIVARKVVQLATRDDASYPGELVGLNAAPAPRSRIPETPARCDSGISPLQKGNHPPIEKNGCGTDSGIGYFVPELDFHEVCNRHDECFQQCQYDFDQCNAEFYPGAEKACDAAHPNNSLVHWICTLLGRWYAWNVTTKLSKAQYDKSTAHYCDCQCPKTTLKNCYAPGVTSHVTG